MTRLYQRSIHVNSTHEINQSSMQYVAVRYEQENVKELHNWGKKC